jgi:hypothetical protein
MQGQYMDGKIRQQAEGWMRYKVTVIVTALVPVRTRRQCKRRWHDFWKHSIDRATALSNYEDSRQRHDAVMDLLQMHTGKDWWVAIAALVSGRTQKLSVGKDGKVSWNSASTASLIK